MTRLRIKVNLSRTRAFKRSKASVRTLIRQGPSASTRLRRLSAREGKLRIRHWPKRWRRGGGCLLWRRCGDNGCVRLLPLRDHGRRSNHGRHRNRSRIGRCGRRCHMLRTSGDHRHECDRCGSAQLGQQSDHGARRIHGSTDSRLMHPASPPVRPPATRKQLQSWCRPTHPRELRARLAFRQQAPSQ